MQANVEVAAPLEEVLNIKHDHSTNDMAAMVTRCEIHLLLSFVMDHAMCVEHGDMTMKSV